MDWPCRMSWSPRTVLRHRITCERRKIVMSAGDMGARECRGRERKGRECEAVAERDVWTEGWG